MLTWLFQETQVRASEMAQEVRVIVAKLDDLSFRKHMTEGERQANKGFLNFCMHSARLLPLLPNNTPHLLNAPQPDT